MTTPLTFPTAPGELAETKPAAPKQSSAETLKAAKEFESLLLRHMLESMQKTAHVGKSDSRANSGYQSMAVEALADGIERGGGLGLSDLIAKTLESEISARGK
jgi:Rod binding domain-containing protein